MLSTLSIIFERVIYNKLYNYLVRNSLLTENQFGFRVKQSTELAHIRYVDYIIKEMHKNTSDNIYVNLSNAFDTIHFESVYTMRYYVSGTPFKVKQKYLIN